MKYVTPDVWGEYFWKTIHVVALGYPGGGASAAQKDAYRAFFESLKTTIPCEVCAKGYANILGKRDLEAALEGGRDSLVRWSVDVHNDVGAKLGKPPMTEKYVKNVYIFEKCGGSEGGPCAGEGTDGQGQQGDRDGDAVLLLAGAALQLGALAAALALSALTGYVRGGGGGVPGR